MKKKFIIFIIFGVIIMVLQAPIMASNDDHPDVVGDWSAWESIIEE